MKTKFRTVLNSMSEDFNIEEATIIEETNEFDTERILSKVMTGIRANNKSKSSITHRRGKLPLILIAAAISAAVIGTTVLASTGVLFPLSYKYKGDTDTLKLYENNSFRFESSNDNLQASFLGLVGDETFTMAVVELTNKDGSVFTEYDGILPTSSFSPEGYYTNTVSRPSNDTDTVISDYDDSAEYYLSKDKTKLNLYLTIQTDYDDVSGTSVKFHSDKFISYRINEKLYSSETLDEYVIYSEELLSADCRWEYEDGMYNLYSYDKIDIPLEYDISFDINEKIDNSIKSELNDKNAPHLVKKGGHLNMKITPFNILLESRTSFTTEELNKILGKEIISNTDTADVIADKIMSNMSDFTDKFSAFSDYQIDIYEYGFGYMSPDLSGFKMLMKDDRVLYNSISPDYNYPVFTKTNDGKTEIVFTRSIIYTDVPYDSEKIIKYNPDDNIRYVINTDEIAKIEIDGDEIYTSPGSEGLVFPDESKIMLIPWCRVDIEHLFTSNLNSINLIYVDSNSGTYTDNPNNNINIIDTKFKGKSEELKQAVSILENERTKGLFISRIKLIPDKADSSSDKEYTMEISIDNPYLISEDAPYKQTKSDIISKYDKYDWTAIISDYLDKGIMPADKNVPFSVQENELPE